MKIKFSSNQLGLAIDYWQDNDWRGLELVKLKQPCYEDEFIQKYLDYLRNKGFTITATKEKEIYNVNM